MEEAVKFQVIKKDFELLLAVLGSRLSDFKIFIDQAMPYL